MLEHNILDVFIIKMSFYQTVLLLKSTKNALFSKSAFYLILQPPDYEQGGPLRVCRGQQAPELPNVT